jgi:TolA-binding protein
LQNSQFDQAQQAWSNILTERPNSPEASQAHYQLIELQFLTGQIDTAQTMLKTLLASKPNTDATNDAIELAALIQDGQQANPALLKDFAHIMLKTRQHKPEEALKALHMFQQNHSGSFLEDRAQFLLAQLQETLGQFPQAIQTYRHVIANMPWSPFCPGAQMAMARIYDLKLGQYYDAKKAYETVLTDYPLSLEADLVRERLRIIQQKIRELESKKEAG